MEMRVIVRVCRAGTGPTSGVVLDTVLSGEGVHNAIVLQPVEQAVDSGLVDPFPQPIQQHPSGQGLIRIPECAEDGFQGFGATLDSHNSKLMQLSCVNGLKG